MAIIQTVRLAHGEISREIIAAFFHVYNRIGGQLPESIYAGAMPVALEMRGLKFEREVPFKVVFEGVTVGSYRMDFVVENTMVVELKSVDKLMAAHEAQVYNYLRISKLPVGLLFNFGPKPQHRRLILPQRQS